MPVHVMILRADLRLPTCQSLKAKRSVVTPIIRHLDQLTAVAAAEVGHNDKWQRTEIGVTAVGNRVSHLEATMDTVERYLWSRGEVEVLELTRWWGDED